MVLVVHDARHQPRALLFWLVVLCPHVGRGEHRLNAVRLRQAKALPPVGRASFVSQREGEVHKMREYRAVSRELPIEPDLTLIKPYRVHDCSHFRVRGRELRH